MAYETYVGSFNIDTTKTATQTQSITGVGFQPKIVLFFSSGATASSDGYRSDTINIMFGAAISSSSRFCCVGISEDGQADSDAYRYQSTTECIRMYTDTGTLDGLMDFSSMDANGFTLVVDDQFTQEYRISYLALGGSDLTDYYIGNQAMPVVGGNYGVSGLGFQPDVLITASALSTSASGGNDDISLFIGMATGSSNQGVVYSYSQDNQATTNTARYGYNGEVNSCGDTNREAFVSFGADGFTLNHLEGATAYYYHYICLAGGQYAVGDLNTRNDFNDIEEDVGFEPAAIFFLSHNNTISTQDTLSSELAISIGAGTSSSNRACAAACDVDGEADSATTTANYDSEVYANLWFDSLVGLMDIKSIDADGFTCVMDDVEGANWVTYLAIGAAAGETLSIAVMPSDFAYWKDGPAIIGSP